MQIPGACRPFHVQEPNLRVRVAAAVPSRTERPAIPATTRLPIPSAGTRLVTHIKANGSRVQQPEARTAERLVLRALGGSAAMPIESERPRRSATQSKGAN